MSVGAIDLSLARIRSLLSHLPKYTRPTIHVAGTNGKGSVTAMVDFILRDSGFITGRFNSPHLICIQDSIKINGRSITRHAYDAASRAVRDVNEENGIRATSFELLTATALCSFEKEVVDVAIVEVGMGGRLDATNAIPDDAILVSGISSIGMDHQSFLGGSLDLIAKEKAGISKQGKPCVVVEQSHPGVMDAILSVVTERGSEAVWVKRARERPWSEELDRCHTTFSLSPFRPPPPYPVDISTRTGSIHAILPLHGEHQLLNVSLAVGLVDTIRKRHPFDRIMDTNIVNGLRSCRWPGRLEWLTYGDLRHLGSEGAHKALLVDGAHNAASSLALAKYLDSLEIPSPRTYILSLSHSFPKSPISVLQPLLRKGDSVAVVPFSDVDGMPWVRPVSQIELKIVTSGLVGEAGFVYSASSLMDALKWARDHTQNGMVVVAGSLYLVADLYSLLDQSW